jgi:type I restriction enzyme S subunit
VLILFPGALEQDAILAAVAKETKELNAAEKTALREIDLLREYRTRLIADVVTGKLDVRQAVARLPDEVDEPDELDDAELMAEGDDEELEDVAVEEEALV